MARIEHGAGLPDAYTVATCVPLPRACPSLCRSVFAPTPRYVDLVSHLAWVPVVFGPFALDYAWAARESASLAWSFVRASALLHVDGPDFPFPSAGVRAISAAASHASVSGWCFASAVHD